MSSFKNADAGVIVDQLIKTIQKERDYLSEIDGKIGDGDHGINMNKGFTMCEKKLEGTTYNLSEGLTTLGETLLEDIGGSMAWFNVWTWLFAGILVVQAIVATLTMKTSND